MVHVVLVDREDRELGTMEKMEAHRRGALHRAFSILVFNSKHELLIQKRSSLKYHSGGLWTNTCCSHPLPGENIEEATRRSLFHEMGIDGQPKFVYKFLYEAALGAGLVEHELDHVFILVYDGEPTINSDEVAEWKYIDIMSLRQDICDNPTAYSCWFKLIMENEQINGLFE